MVSCPEYDTLYYLYGQNIYRLNTKTCERKNIASLPWLPRCMVAAHGWLCCGGESGHFAVVRIAPDNDDDEESGSSTPADPDSRLPLDFEAARVSGLSATLGRSGLRSQWDDDAEPQAIAKTAEIGGDLVNCITIWAPQEDKPNQTYPTPVAVLSNNDRTVTIVDVRDLTTIQSFSLGDCVNRAVISPDGRVLIAIGDDPFMYIYTRKQKENKGPFAKPKPEFEWSLCTTYQLEGQRLSDKEDMRGSFATAFNGSGRMLAVGTQYGVISVFDVSLLTNPDADPLVTSFKTSRPGTRNGAVRAMEFAKDPIDLLAWIENSERMGIADLRDKFHSRQTIHLDARADAPDRIPVHDLTERTVRPGDTLLDPRLRSLSSSLSRFYPQNPEADRRELRLWSRELLERDQLPLSSEETEVLEALQLHRRQREAREAARNAETSMSVEATERAANPRWAARHGSNATVSAERNTRSSTSSNLLPTSLREYINIQGTDNSLRNNETLRAYIQERNSDRERRNQPPRRRGSVILASAQNALDRERDREREREAQTSSSSSSTRQRFNISPPQPPQLPPLATTSETTPNPWTEIENLYSLEIDPPSGTTGDPSTRVRVELEIEEYRDQGRRNQSNWRPLGPIDGRSHLRSLYDGSLRESINQTGYVGNMGCCWSPDGRKL